MTDKNLFLKQKLRKRKLQEVEFYDSLETFFLSSSKNTKRKQLP